MKPRIGIIGGGIYGTKMLSVYSAAHKKGEIELVCLADIKEKILKEQEKKFSVKGYLDYKEMIRKENLDGVAVVTPDYLHREIALEVANQGIHMLVQKPLDLSVKGALEMVETAKENNVMLYVDFHKRFDPVHIQLKKDIEEGKIGKVQYGYIWAENRIVLPTVWFKEWAMNSSPAWFLGIHWFDLIFWLLKQKPIKIYATSNKDKLVKLGIDTIDSIQVKIEFENGANFSVDCSWILPNSFSERVNQGIRIVGSDGIWEIDSQNRGALYCNEEEQQTIVPNFYSMTKREDPINGTIFSGYVVESMQFFIKLITMLKRGVALNDLQGYYPSGEEAVVSTQIAEAAHRSAERREIIDLKKE